MINVRDLYTWSKVVPMIPDSETSPSSPIGTLTVEYEVHRLIDVRNLTTVRGYILDVRQRVQLSNDGTSLMGDGTITAYTYPVLFTTSIALTPGGTIGKHYYISRADPKTVNSSVSMNVTGSKAGSVEASSQVTAGSSTSTTNTFSFSPLSGPENSDSSTDTTFSEVTVGASLGSTLTSGASDTMSVKDWSSFICIDANNTTPTWTWAQTFPWDVIKYHYTGNGSNVALPHEITDLLWDGTSAVYPPSDLSLFGLNFSMHATWVLLCDGSASTDVTSVTHVVSPYIGYHGYTTTTPTTDWAVTLTPGMEFAYAGPDDNGNATFLDLAQLALDPISSQRPSTGATVGFVPSQFVTIPSNEGGFSITSTNNTLLVRGTGFSDPASTDAPMTANVTGSATAIASVFFKIIDPDSDYTLFLKNWVMFGSNVGVTLTITVNGTSITRHVDALEAGSGTDNVTQVILRRKSYSSDEYFDYLVMGLNSITIEVSSDQSAASPPPSCGYSLRALAIA